jgi:hypothetical protein
MVNASFDQSDRREQRIAVLARETRQRSAGDELRTITPIASTISASKSAVSPRSPDW